MNHPTRRTPAASLPTVLSPPVVLCLFGLLAFVVAVAGLGVGTASVTPAGVFVTALSAAAALSVPVLLPTLVVLAVVHLLESA
jgi:hypothetical protein